MMRSVVKAARAQALRLAAMLCSRTPTLPGAGSSIDREWRFGLYRALSDAEAGWTSATKCDLGQLFQANTGVVYSSAQKDSASESIIVGGVLAPPSDPASAARYADAWQRIKCDVIAKITFPRLDQQPSKKTHISPLEAELILYDFLTNLVESDVTPNLMMGLAHYRCRVVDLHRTSNATLAHDLIREAKAIYAENETELLPNDPVRVLLLERGRGCELAKCLDQNRVDQEQLLLVLFQTLYTLHVLARRGIRHGDLHADNVYVDMLGARDSTVAYFLDTQTYYEVPTRGTLAKIYDWDWGGIYNAPEKRKRKTAQPKNAWPWPNRNVSNEVACEAENAQEMGACGVSGKGDAFTLLSYLYHETKAREMPLFRAFVERCIDKRLLDLAPSLENYGGFSYRLCSGVLRVRCPTYEQADVLVKHPKCSGIWIPDECYLLSPLQMMQQPEFQQFRHTLGDRYPQTEYVFGDWQSREQRDDLFRLLRRKPIDVALRGQPVEPIEEQAEARAQPVRRPAVRRRIKKA